MKVSTKQIAPIVGVSPDTLNTWRCRGVPYQPPYHKVGRTIRYDVAEVESWLRCRRVCK